MEMQIDNKDIIVMKLLHFFITEKGYNPIALQGAKNEIWLENMDSEYKIIRIVSNYIHNNEQFDLDLYKTKRVVSNIKKKTFNLKMNVLSIFTDLGENVNLSSEKHIDCIYVKDEKDVSKYNFLYKYFPDIDKKISFSEKGLNLFMKITEDINNKNKKEVEILNDVFKTKKPIITYILIGINILIFLIGFLLNKSDYLVNQFSTYGPYIRLGEYYRIITGTFIHVEIFHIAFNMYALYIVGSQAENFFGKLKYLTIYLFSAITGSLLSIIFSGDVPSIGASGAIFGILGSLLFFGYNYRAYFGNVLIKQLVPIILLNLFLGFASTGIDNFAHIGGLIGGYLIAKFLSIKHKNNFSERINALILTTLYLAFLIFMNFFYIN